jgi:hypothetical protein
MVFEFLANLTNYSPKNFKGKSVKEILAMKPSKVSDDFFSVGNEPAIAEAGLMKEQLQAIELLMDLKNKEKILEKCYANRPVKRYSVVPGHHSAKKEQAPALEPVEAVEQGQAQAQAQAPAEQGPAEQGPAEQGGGGKRTKKHRHKHSRHKHKSHRHKHSKRCRHSKHRSHKHSKRCRHSKHKSHKH